MTCSLNFTAMYFNTYEYDIARIWMNEWMNEWMNIHLSVVLCVTTTCSLQCTNTYEYDIARIWMNEWVNEWMNEWMNEHSLVWLYCVLGRPVHCYVHQHLRVRHCGWSQLCTTCCQTPETVQAKVNTHVMLFFMMPDYLYMCIVVGDMAAHISPPF